MRGYRQESLLVRAERGELLLVRGIATICDQCGTMKLYFTNESMQPGCSCWVLSEVQELARYLREGTDGLNRDRLELLQAKYSLRYGVLVHDSGEATFRFYEIKAFHRLRAQTGLSVMTYPSGELFFMAS